MFFITNKNPYITTFWCELLFELQKKPTILAEDNQSSAKSVRITNYNK